MGGRGPSAARVLLVAATVSGLGGCCCGSPIVFHVAAPSQLRPPSGTPVGGRQLGSLAEAAEAVARAQAEDIPREIVVELGPGAHRVPPGGLQLGSEHSSSSSPVTWRASTAGTSSIHGGIAITGWRPAADPALPDGVVVAPVPAALKGQRLRHLYVGGVRAHRTRTPAAYLNLTLATAADGPLVAAATAGSCNLTGTWRVGGHNHWAAVAEHADGSFVATAHNVPHGGWTIAQGIALPNGSVSVMFNQGKGSDHATVTGGDCDHINWADARPHPSWSRRTPPGPSPTPGPGPPSPSPPLPVSSLGGYYLANSSEPLSAWTNIGDVEFVYSGVASNWAETRCTVAIVTTGARSAAQQSSTGAHTAGATTKIVLKQPCFWNLLNTPWHPIATSPPAFIENVRAHLTERGSFYYDLSKVTPSKLSVDP